jgi:hypothetical protein
MLLVGGLSYYRRWSFELMVNVLEMTTLVICDSFILRIEVLVP